MSDDDPFAQIERLVNQLGTVGSGGEGIAIDVVEDEAAIEVTADLAGYESEDIDVELHDGTQLEISAERSTEREDTDGQVHRRERRHEAVSRSLTLPVAVDEAGTEAAYANGVLTVRLPKAAPDGDGTEIAVN
jgi:HSP20 family protein